MVKVWRVSTLSGFEITQLEVDKVTSGWVTAGKRRVATSSEGCRYLTEFDSAKQHAITVLRARREKLAAELAVVELHLREIEQLRQDQVLESTLADVLLRR